jgi:hypothetical protein
MSIPAFSPAPPQQPVSPPNPVPRSQAGYEVVESPNYVESPNDYESPQQYSADQQEFYEEEEQGRGYKRHRASSYNQQQPKVGMAITGMVIGICSLVIAIIPCGWMIAPLPAVLGIIFSGIGLAQARKFRGTPKPGKKMAIAGLVTSILALLTPIFWLLAMGAAINQAAKQLDKDVNKALKQVDRDFNKALKQIDEDFDDIFNKGPRPGRR